MKKICFSLRSKSPYFPQIPSVLAIRRRAVIARYVPPRKDDGRGAARGLRRAVAARGGDHRRAVHVIARYEAIQGTWYGIPDCFVVPPRKEMSDHIIARQGLHVNRNRIPTLIERRRCSTLCPGAPWSAETCNPLTGLCGRVARFSIDMQPLTGLYLLLVIPFCLILIILIRNERRLRRDAMHCVST
jgi:hypothetical protein